MSRSKKDNKNDSKPMTTSDNCDKSVIANYITDAQLLKILSKRGINSLFPIQYQTFKIIHKGQDVIAKDRTGSGKTFAYALPMIVRMRQQHRFKGSHCPRFLIVLPTRQLALQVKDEIMSLQYKDQQDFIVAAVYGGSGMQEQLDIVGKGVDILVGTPGRLIDFMNRGCIKLNELQAICLDEADEMLKIGFKEDIQKIFQHLTQAKTKTTKKTQCLFFSATIPDWILQISKCYQSANKIVIDMIKNNHVQTSKTVQHFCLKTSSMEKQAYLGSLIKYFFKGKNCKIIIFCQTKREVDRIGNSGLIPLSFEMLHGDIKQFLRQKIFRKFKNGNVDCLIATNVAARGLDFPEIDLIIQMQPPPTTDQYIHRSGRTGRAGKSGICVTLYCFKEEYLIKKIQKQAKITFRYINSKELKPVVGNEEKRTNNDRSEHHSGGKKKKQWFGEQQWSQKRERNDKSKLKYLNDESDRVEKRNKCQEGEEERKVSFDKIDY